MKYISTEMTARKWGISERSVREYCHSGRVEGAILVGKSWLIPENANKPPRKNDAELGRKDLLTALRKEKAAKLSGGIYHKLQIELTYNSNHIEGSRLSHEQTRYIYETNTVGAEGVLNVDDIVEASNHFRCIDFVIDKADAAISETFIKHLHYLLKSGTSDSRVNWFMVGDYKRAPNEVGEKDTTPPSEVGAAMRSLIDAYNEKDTKTFEEILDFHHRFEAIHPFQDGNGRVGRLIILKECLKHKIVPFVIDEELKLFYYRGLSEWGRERGYLIETCRAAQDKFKAWLDYFKIEYDKSK